jgi:CheY-like chemotaxis protein
MASNNPENNATTVLIVDDDPFVLEMVKEQLFHLGHEVLTACCGKDALQKAKEYTGIDLLLTDVMMPSMNGIELAKEFVKLVPKVKIVFMSGYLSLFVRDDELPQEKYPILEKPFSLDKLKSEFTRVLTN